MADFWKSTPRKFCDFCKCWFGDNKASIDFHERGKNHQENVKRRLAEIKKKSMEKRQENEAAQSMLAAMEKAALAAVKKDFANDSESFGKSDLKSLLQGTVKTDGLPSSGSSEISTHPWCSMQTLEGHTYYYNSISGESTWEMPAVFRNLPDSASKQANAVASTSPELLSSNSVAPISKNSTKDRRIQSESSKDPLKDQHPLLGGWSSVSTPRAASGGNSPGSEEGDEEEPTAVVPVADVVSPSTSVTNSSAKRDVGMKFKERVVSGSVDESNSSSAQVSFKKRKGVSRNVRKRDDED